MTASSDTLPTATRVSDPGMRALYRLEKWETDVKTLLRASDGYYGKRGNVTEAQYLVVSSAATRVAGLISGEIDIVPLRSLAFRMAELADAHQMSALAAEAVAAAEHLDAPLYVWSGDVGPRMKAAADAIGVDYVVIER